MPSLSPQPLLSEEDYGAIEAAVMETARGRWFLAEYARRNRNADTEAVLAAIRRLERLVHSAGTFDAREEVTRGMADIAQAIAAAQVSPAVGMDANAEAFAGEDEDEPAPIEVGETISAEVTPPAEPPVSEEAADELELMPETSHSAPVVDEVEPAAAQVESVIETQALPRLAAPPERGDSQTVVEETGAYETALAAEDESLDEVPFAAAVATPEPFPILELDEEATEALLTLDVPRQELILPANHLSTQRWHKETGGEENGHVDYRLDRWALTADRNEPLPAAIAIENVAADAPAAPPPARASAEPAKPAGLVTFIDEEPVDEDQSIFTAPLRLEPEEVTDEAQAVLPQIRPAIERIAVPRLTIGEIEAMPFAKKAALFS